MILPAAQWGKILDQHNSERMVTHSHKLWDALAALPDWEILGTFARWGSEDLPTTTPQVWDEFIALTRGGRAT